MAPFSVGLAVSFSDGSGVLETFTEVAAIVSERARGAKNYPGNELIAALVADRDQPKPPMVEPGTPGGAPVNIAAELRARAIIDCRRILSLLEERSHPEESGGYRHFLMDVARATSMASRHGGWMNRGPAIDEPERALLCELADALDVEVGDLPDGLTCGEPGEVAIPARDMAPASRADGGPEIPNGPISPE